jgi:hypothetical protein
VVTDGILVPLWSLVLGTAVSAICWTRPRPVKAVHVGIGYATLSGVGKAYLDSVGPTTARSRDADDMAASARALRERLAKRSNPSAPQAPPPTA